jgi:hypothetical protein
MVVGPVRVHVLPALRSATPITSKLRFHADPPAEALPALPRSTAA